MSVKEFLEDMVVFFGIPDLILCAHCNRGTVNGCGGEGNCIHCDGHGVVQANGEPVDDC